jgi:hypothetical protein
MLLVCYYLSEIVMNIFAYLFIVQLILYMTYGTSSNQNETGNFGDTLGHTRENRAKIEALNYLGDRSKELQSLSNYSNVSATFLKYNTTLPSSAPVERLFSVGGLILTPRRNKLSDATFQKLLMLKTNAYVTS